MIVTIHEVFSTARKDYHCNACEFLFNDDDMSGFTFAEYRAIVTAKWNGKKILKGQKYIRQFNTDGGHTWTFRAIPEIHKICVKYNLYDE